MSKAKITICLGSSCYARGNAKNIVTTQKFLEERGLSGETDLELGGELCTGNCSDGPIVVVNGEIHRHVDTGAMRDILEKLFG